jgi:hypothetical protein
LAASFGGGHAGAKLVFDVEFEVGSQGVVKIAVEPFFAPPVRCSGAVAKVTSGGVTQGGSGGC